jgi:hypothetical protein
MDTKIIIVVLEYLVDGQRVRYNLDFICGHTESNSNDYHFVLSVWLSLFRKIDIINHFTSIDVWTDGGPHHFKTRYCQWMWHWLSTHLFNQQRITHHFFVSYHGHSIADAHAASAKCLLHNDYSFSQFERLSTTSAIYWGHPTPRNSPVSFRNAAKQLSSLLMRLIVTQHSNPTATQLLISNKIIVSTM